MNSCSIIIQGEGKGHFSQALVAIDLLKQSGTLVRGVYLGRSLMRKNTPYIVEETGIRVKRFLSPNFLRSADRKGIRIVATLLVNMVLAPVYLFECCRIGILMRRDRSNIVINFYDPLGSLAARWWKRSAERVVVSHHFYLSHPDFIHPHGMDGSYFWLQFMNRIMMRSASRVLALSFREGEKFRKIEVVPPLIDRRVRDGMATFGERDLCYFLNPGFVDEMVEFYRKNRETGADIFASEGYSGELPENVSLFSPSREVFLNKLSDCRRVISTAGFDLVAEAMYLGIPVFVIPSENHYEQYCNAIDASRTGMAFQLDSLSELEDVDFVPSSNRKQREWIESSNQSHYFSILGVTIE